MFDKQGLQSDDLLLFEQYRLSNLLSSFDSFTEVIEEEFSRFIFEFLNRLKKRKLKPMKNVAISLKNIFYKLNESFILNLSFKFSIKHGQNNRLLK
jgi:hypothetical protein